MTMPQRVFITGLSALSAAGLTLDENWQRILQGKTAIAPMTAHELPNWPHRLAGELPDFVPAKALPDRKLIKVIARQDAIGINAAMQAIQHSGLVEWRDQEASSATDVNEMMGVYVGSPGNKYFQQYDFLPLMAKSQGDMSAFAEHLFTEVHPMWLLRTLPNNVLAYVGIHYGFKGANHNVTNHAAGGMQALIEAAHAVRTGQVERAVVVAYDVGAEPQALLYYDKMGLISGTGLRPFAHDHDGTVLAEGAAALVLESEEAVAQRQAHCYGEITALATQTEAHGLFSIDADGTPLSTMLTQCLDQYAIAPSDIGCVIAHGNGNPRSDCSEARALKQVFGERQPLLTAFKWAMGHTLTCSGLLDTVLACQALNCGQLPGLPGVEQAAADCQHLDIAAASRALPAHSSALIINRGFASMNSALVVRACV
ncbi:MAG: 3-oxoacyl-ACP synthase [Legionellaceae bacterium]|nr:3-oxoacyl-ACP synthase [Legionellaceae bacterium]